MWLLHVEKRIYHGLPDLMTKVAREELDELGDDIDECNVMYLPQVYFLCDIVCIAQRFSSSYHY